MASHKRRPVRALVTLTVSIVAACAALAIGHLTEGVSPYPDLALDLKGGTQLILTPTVTGDGQREITEEDITQAISIIRNRIDASGVDPRHALSGAAGPDSFVLADELPSCPAHRRSPGRHPEPAAIADGHAAVRRTVGCSVR